jgi:hypothetical protein
MQQSGKYIPNSNKLLYKHHEEHASSINCIIEVDIEYQQYFYAPTLTWSNGAYYVLAFSVPSDGLASSFHPSVNSSGFLVNNLRTF